MKLKSCPFCGGKIQTAKVFTNIPLMFFKCMNYNSCGATISFDNPVCNKNPESSVKYFNRRVKWG